MSKLLCFQGKGGSGDFTYGELFKRQDPGAINQMGGSDFIAKLQLSRASLVVKHLLFFVTY